MNMPIAFRLKQKENDTMDPLKMDHSAIVDVCTECCEAMNRKGLTLHEKQSVVTTLESLFFDEDEE